MRFLVVLIAVLYMSGCEIGSGNTQLVPSQPVINTAPIATDISVSTQAGTAVSGMLVASDLDGDTLTFALVNSPANGSVTLSGTGNRNFEYTPDSGFSGSDSFTYNANDSIANSNTATVTITVNTPPSASSASYTTSDLGTITDTVSASDADGDSLTFSVSTQPGQGALTSFDTATGDFVYTPDVGADGADSFAVTVSDGLATSDPATISIEIFGWAGTQQLGSSAYDAFITNGLIFRSDGGQLLAGSTEGQVASMPNAGGFDFFLRGTDRRGNQTSIAQFGDSGDNNVRGLFARPQDDGYYVVVSGAGDNIYRFDNAGTEIYSVPLPVEGATTLVIAAYWATVDDSGDLYVLSWLDTSDPTVAHAGLVSRINGADGTLVWQRELLTSTDDAVNFFIDDSDRIAPRGADIDSSGNLVIAGEFWDTGGARPCQRCGFVARLDAATGADLWLREPDAFASCGDGNGRFYRVTVAADDALYLNGIANFSAFPGGDGLMAKYSADGTAELWSDCDDSGADTTSYFTNPLITADGNVINYGSVGDATSPPDTNGGPTEAFLTLQKYDATTGTVVWTRIIQPARADGSAANAVAGSVAEDSDGVLYITGGTDGELTEAAGAGDIDAFIIRIGADGTVQ